MPRIDPAPLAFDAAGVPFSPRYGDIYHSADSGPGQARHVFLAGNGLPQRWGGREHFTILETGFGQGLNFLATWQAWRDDPGRCERLSYVSIEKHPFTAESLASLHARLPEFGPIAAELREKWPLPLPGLHRIALAGGRVLLTLALGDAAELLRKLEVCPDAIYLDGFSPARNPDMWTASLLKAVARKARPGTTLSTYTSAAAVRRALEEEGFACEKRQGFGHKREMLCANFAPRWHRRGSPAMRTAPADRHAMVIGAGLAGAAMCERLASRGWQVSLLESASAPATGASGLRAGAFHPHVSPDDCLLSRLSRNAFLLGLSRWNELELASSGLQWSRCGVLQLPHHAREEEAMRNTLALLGYPPEYLRHIGAGEAADLAACRTAGGGWWFPQGGWLRAQSLVQAQLAHAGARADARFDCAVHSLEREGGLWHARSQDGRLLAAAPVAVLANAADAQNLADFGAPLKRIRGQLSFVPQTGAGGLRIVVSGVGYALPPMEGIMPAGSTYEPDDEPLLPRAEAHAANLARLARLLPGLPPVPAPELLDGQEALRAVARDRLPLIGAIPDLVEARRRKLSLAGAQLADLPRRPDLYCATGFGSRGIIWSALAAELLASQLEGEPLPLESDLSAAVDPARFVIRSLRQGRL